MKKHIHFLAIGSELVSGEITDLNGSWLASWLNSRGIELSSISVLPDNDSQIIDFLSHYDFSKSQLIISGGLGPTKDDKTKSIVSSFFEAPLVRSQKAFDIASSQYLRAGKTYKETGYELIPQHWSVFDNPTGLAPGLMHPQTAVMLLPGVPSEFRSMIAKHLASFLNTQSLGPQADSPLKQQVRFFGMSEEKIFFELAPTLWKELEKWGEVSCLPKFPRVDIGVQRVENKPHLSLEQFKEIINSHLEQYHPDFEKNSIEQLLVKTLKNKKMLVSTAESCTGGFCSHLITQVSGASQVFESSFICYSQSSKAKNLDIAPNLMEEHTVYSHQVVEKMAQNVCSKTQANLGIAISGIAGPSGGTKQVPVGSVFVGICLNGETKTYQREFRGEREVLKERFASWALLLAYQQLLFS